MLSCCHLPFAPCIVRCHLPLFPLPRPSFPVFPFISTFSSGQLSLVPFFFFFSLFSLFTYLLLLVTCPIVNFHLYAVHLLLSSCLKLVASYLAFYLLSLVSCYLRSADFFSFATHQLCFVYSNLLEQ